MQKITVNAVLEAGRPARITMSITVDPSSAQSIIGELIDHGQAIADRQGQYPSNYEGMR